VSIVRPNQFFLGLLLWSLINVKFVRLAFTILVAVRDFGRPNAQMKWLVNRYEREGWLSRRYSKRNRSRKHCALTKLCSTADVRADNWDGKGRK
jgi:hypothetical protein